MRLPLTDDERLYNAVSYKKLKELIMLKGIKVYDLEENSNSYGLFTFLTLYGKNYSDTPITFYGLGLHEYKNVYYINVFKFYSSSKFDIQNKKPIPKKKVLEYLAKKRRKIMRLDRKEQRKPDSKYILMSELADEDFACSNLYY